jgi:hypothetical protein
MFGKLVVGLCFGSFFSINASAAPLYVEFNAPRVVDTQIPGNNADGLYVKLTFADDALITAGRVTYRWTNLLPPYNDVPPPLPGPNLIKVEYSITSSNGVGGPQSWDILNWGLSSQLGSAYIGYTNPTSSGGFVDIELLAPGKLNAIISVNNFFDGGVSIESQESNGRQTVLARSLANAGTRVGIWTFSAGSSQAIPTPSTLLLLLTCLVPFAMWRTRK